MAVCKFFLEGRCRYGDNCKNEHPGEQRSQFGSTNRFGALQSGGFSRGSSGGGDRYRPGDNRNQALPYNLTRDGIKLDFTIGPPDGDRPVWPMSCYGPGKDAPRQLIEGPDYEISPEEVRVLFYTAQASGDPAQIEQYKQNEQAAAAKAHQAGQEIVNDPDRYIKLVLDAENQHPNRLDQVIKPAGPWQKPSGFSNSTTSTFGENSSTLGQQSSTQTNNSPFGQRSSSQTDNSPFGAFGGQSQQPSSGFGAPSALGGGSSAFGRPSLPGSNASPFAQAAQKPAFGAASSLSAPTPAFGAPSMGSQAPAFGAASQPQSAFGQPSTMSTTSPFAQQKQTNSFGFGSGNTTTQEPTGSGNNSTQQQIGPFGVFSSQSQTSGFGQASKLGQTQSSSPFAQNNNSTLSPQPQPSPFAQAANSGSTNAKPFGSGFGAASGGSVFGSAPGFGSAAPGSGGFGAVSGQSKTSPFAQNNTPTPAAPQVNGFGKVATPQPAAQVGSAVSEYSTRNPNGMLQTWKGNTVVYVKLPGEGQTGPPVPVFRNNRGKQERIWLPDGPPSQPNRDVEGLPEAYAGNVGEVLKRAYEFVAQNGGFENGIMPEVPPLNEWKRWDV